MFKRKTWIPVLISLLAPWSVRAGAAWAELRIGMTELEAEATLGKPLLRSVGRDYAVWIYDHRAELVFYGPLIAWTAPSERGVPGRSVDVWQRPVSGVGVEPVFLPKPERYKPTQGRRAPVVRRSGVHPFGLGGETRSYGSSGRRTRGAAPATDRVETASDVRQKRRGRRTTGP